MEVGEPLYSPIRNFPFVPTGGLGFEAHPTMTEISNSKNMREIFRIISIFLKGEDEPLIVYTHNRGIKFSGNQDDSKR
jgi:hypothetical protein